MIDPINTYTEAIEICAELNELGLEHVGQTFVYIEGGETFISLQLVGETLYSDQEDGEEDFTAEKCRQRIITHATDLLEAYATVDELKLLADSFSKVADA